MTLMLTNPHSVLAALAVRPGDVIEVRVPRSGAGDAWHEVADVAREAGIPVVTVADDGAEGGPPREGGPRGRGRDGGERERRAGGHERGAGAASGRGRPGRGPPGRPARSRDEPPKEGRSGRALAVVRERQPLELSELLPAGASGRGLWLALDQVQDPRNVGATFRSAAFFGVAGVILTRDRSAPLSSVAYDAASGGLEHVPFSSPPNLARALEAAKEAGLWILGAAEEAGRDVAEIDRQRPWLLVLGGEESGLRRLTRENCDELCRLTPRGPVTSLNVSVAASVLMSELTRAP